MVVAAQWRMMLALVCLLGWSVQARGQVDPLFDFEQITSTPLDAQVLESRTQGGLVIERIEYTAWVQEDGQPLRIKGILAYPEGGSKLPAVFWSQGGMAPASEHFPRVFALKGYFCLNVTLPHGSDTWQAFNTADPKQANLTRKALIQLRGITLMTQRPEVDADRVGVAGSSYGGVFATLIAGADPRIKAGASFFSGGAQHLGTHLPQFLHMKSLEDVEVWRKTIDPALRLQTRAVPMIWGVAANDHWFLLPSLMQTYAASVGEKRMGIQPQWSHGLPPNMDQQLIDWFDIYLTKTRKPYNQVSDPQMLVRDGRLWAKWVSSGDNQVTRAQLLVSYGPVLPWEGWVHRYAQPIEATPVTGEAGAFEAEIPVPERGIEMLVWATVVDENQVVISSQPQRVKPAELGVSEPTTKPKLNIALVQDFSLEDKRLMEALGTPIRGVFDEEVQQAGTHSLRLDAAPEKGRPGTVIKLHTVPRHDHVLRLWVRADKDDDAAQLTVQVRSVPPQDGNFAVVKLLKEQQGGTPTSGTQIAPFEVRTAARQQWQQVEIACPHPVEPIEGYELHVQGSEAATFWIDSLEFEPLWDTR